MLNPNYYTVFKLNMFFTIVLVAMALCLLIVYQDQSKEIKENQARLEWKVDHVLESAVKNSTKEVVKEVFAK